MKLIFECVHCAHEEIEKGIYKTEPTLVSIQELADKQIYQSIVDDNVYYFKCKKGHDNIVYLNNPKFEILFESGINALLDGYYAESVLTMTAALERTYEFFVELICYKNGLEPELYKQVFKLVSSQSERQLGAFYFLYTNSLKKRPPVFELVEFRNKVIHKGIIPVLEETDKYARHIFDLIKNIYIDAVEYCGNEVFRKYMDVKHQNSFPKIAELHGLYQTYQSSMTVPTMLCHMLVLDIYKQRDFDSALQNSKYWKEKIDDPIISYMKKLGEVTK